MGLAWVAKAWLQTSSQSHTPVESRFPIDGDSFPVTLSNRLNQTRYVVFVPIIILVTSITSVILTTITNTAIGYCVSHMPHGLMMVGFPEQWVLPRNYQ